MIPDLDILERRVGAMTDEDLDYLAAAGTPCYWTVLNEVIRRTEGVGAA